MFPGLIGHGYIKYKTKTRTGLLLPILVYACTCGCQPATVFGIEPKEEPTTVWRPAFNYESGISLPVLPVLDFTQRNPSTKEPVFKPLRAPYVADGRPSTIQM